MLALVGLIIIVVLMALRVRGNILLGILITTIIGAFIKGSTGVPITNFTGSVVALPNWGELSQTFGAMDVMGALKWALCPSYLPSLLWTCLTRLALLLAWLLS